MSRWFSFWRTPYQLLDCTGPYAISCADLMSGGEAGVYIKYGSFIRLFYPTDKTERIAKAGKDDGKCLWLPRREYAEGLINFMKLPVWLLGGFLRWCTGSIRIPAVWNAPIVSEPECQSQGVDVTDLPRLPCVVFSPGLGGNRFLYSLFCCDLASHGCVVACVEHRDASSSATYILKKEEGSQNLKEEWIPYQQLSPDDDEFNLRNKQVCQRVLECSDALTILETLHSGNAPENLLGNAFDLNCFKGRLDLDKVAMVGHSFGGATTVKSLINDKRFRCGVALDAWMLPLGDEVFQQDLDRPILFINSEKFHRWRANMTPLKKLVEAKPDERSVIAIRGTAHMNQSDIPSALPPYVLRLTRLGSTLDQDTAVSLNREAIWAFLTRHLGIGIPGCHKPILDGGEETSEHIVFGTDMNVGRSSPRRNVTTHHNSQL